MYVNSDESLQILYINIYIINVGTKNKNDITPN